MSFLILYIFAFFFNWAFLLKKTLGSFKELAFDMCVLCFCHLVSFSSVFINFNCCFLVNFLITFSNNMFKNF